MNSLPENSLVVSMSAPIKMMSNSASNSFLLVLYYSLIEIYKIYCKLAVLSRRWKKPNQIPVISFVKIRISGTSPVSPSQTPR